MTKNFYSNGKLLLTGEYVVLDGAKALALPTKMGQDLQVTESDALGSIHWKSFDADQAVWFEDTISTIAIVSGVLENEDASILKILKNILFQAHQLNPTILMDKGFVVETHLTFPRHWGLGTSSTLINNVAQWFEINAFDLLKNSFGGSGYDIANAQNNTPIYYQILEGKPMVQAAAFAPTFKDNLYFLYLNQKQDSKAAIAMYYEKQYDIQETITEIDRITAAIEKSANVLQFAYLLEQHEAILSKVLEMKTVKERFFADFKGTIKSLGAWGGDFVLIVSATNPKRYFETKGFNILLSYDEMIL